VPEGLLFRGKYCGKSRLKSKVNENDTADKKDGISSVNPID